MSTVSPIIWGGGWGNKEYLHSSTSHFHNYCFSFSFLALLTCPLLPLPQSFTFVYAQSGNLTTSKFTTSFWKSPILVLTPSSSFVPIQKTAWQNLQLQSNLGRNEIKISMLPTVLFLVIPKVEHSK